MTIKKFDKGYRMVGRSMPLKDGDPLRVPITEFAVGAGDPEKVAHELEEGGLYRDVEVTIAKTRHEVPATVRISGTPDDEAILAARRPPRDS